MMPAARQFPAVGSAGVPASPVTVVHTVVVGRHALAGQIAAIAMVAALATAVAAGAA